MIIYLCVLRNKNFIQFRFISYFLTIQKYIGFVSFVAFITKRLTFLFHLEWNTVEMSGTNADNDELVQTGSYRHFQKLSPSVVIPGQKYWSPSPSYKKLSNHHLFFSYLFLFHIHRLRFLALFHSLHLYFLEHIFIEFLYSPFRYLYSFSGWCWICVI